MHCLFLKVLQDCLDSSRAKRLWAIYGHFSLEEIRLEQLEKGLYNACIRFFMKAKSQAARELLAWNRFLETILLLLCFWLLWLLPHPTFHRPQTRTQTGPKQPSHWNRCLVYQVLGKEAKEIVTEMLT